MPDNKQLQDDAYARSSNLESEIRLWLESLKGKPVLSEEAISMCYVALAYLKGYEIMARTRIVIE